MIPNINIPDIADNFSSLADHVLAAFEESEHAHASKATEPSLLIDAMTRLLEVFRQMDQEDMLPPPELANTALSGRDIHVLGDYGLSLLGELSAWAARLHMPQEAKELEGLTFPLGCWIARHGGELSNLAPVVNSAAALANSISKPAELERLYALLGEIVDAVSPHISEDPDKTSASRPWRVLLVNRAILATRSLQPRLMHEAFQSLVDQLPEEAPQFFREGMEQMAAIDYPPNIRAVMQEYYDSWAAPRTLH
jgi:hypothetical protein